MADIRAGGAVTNPHTGKVVSWTPTEPVADEYDAVKALAGKGYSCLGVIGNASHLLGSGGHTPWCSEGYHGVPCKLGKVYAIDLEVPNMLGLETWLIARIRSGAYSWLYYFNVNGHQYSRVDGWRGRYSSADYHLHLSGLAGHENDNSSILRDWEAHRSGSTPTVNPNIQKGDDMATVPQDQWDRARALLDALSDAINGGKGSGYKQSILRADHGFQIDEITRRMESYVDAKFAELETKLDALAAVVTPATGQAPPAA